MERVVAALERCIVPGAKVEHDKWLPNLKTGHKVQCDVLIRYGNPPRQTLSIVEVQKRKKKVDPNDFRGWCRKRDELGAQHLICVSESGFPRSIVDDAKIQGESVRLLTLAELEGKNWPIKLIDKSLMFVEVSPFDIREMKLVSDGPVVSLEVKWSDPLFHREGIDRQLTPNDLALEAVRHDQRFQFQPDGEYGAIAQYVPPVGSALNLVRDGLSTPIRAVEFTMRVRVARTQIPVTCSEYVQTNYKGALAYALTGSGIVGGNQVHARMIFVPEGSGLMQLVSCEVDGLPGALSGIMMFVPRP